MNGENTVIYKNLIHLKTSAQLIVIQKPFMIQPLEE